MPQLYFALEQPKSASHDRLAWLGHQDVFEPHRGLSYYDDEGECWSPGTDSEMRRFMPLTS